MNPIRENQIKKNAGFLGITEEEYIEFFEKELSCRYEFEYMQACLELRKNIEKLAAQLKIITPGMIFSNSLPDIEATMNSIIFLENKIAILRNLRKE